MMVSSWVGFGMLRVCALRCMVAIMAWLSSIHVSVYPGIVRVSLPSVHTVVGNPVALAILHAGFPVSWSQLTKSQ